MKFLSTLPAWGATQNIGVDVAETEISIHAPRVGSDAMLLVWTARTIRFLSTLPAWGATCQLVDNAVKVAFLSTLPAWGATMPYFYAVLRFLFLSTLPAWGATKSETVRLFPSLNFYPRSPRGERLIAS